MNERKKRNPEYNLANRRKKQARNKILRIVAIIAAVLLGITLLVTVFLTIRAEINSRFTKDGESILTHSHF